VPDVKLMAVVAEGDGEVGVGKEVDIPDDGN